MRVVLQAAFDRFSGYGNDGIDLAVNLQKAGVDVVPWPTGLLPGIPLAFAKLLTKDPRGHADVHLTFGDPRQIRPWETHRLAARRVGYTMWERTPLLVEDFPYGIGEPWADPQNPGSPLERLLIDRAYDGLDAMVVTCGMNIDAIRGVDAHVPVYVVPCGIEPEDWPVAKRDPSRRMRFLMVGALNGRKMPFVLLDAWKALKEKMPEFDAELHVHTTARGLHPGVVEAYGPDVTLTSQTLDREGVVAMYHDADVLVNVARGEGNDKPAMEMMATGGTVMLPAWGGHENWLHRDVGYALAGRLSPDPTAPRAQSFEVDGESLQSSLLEAWQDRAMTSQMGMRAAPHIRQIAGWERVTADMIRVLEGR